ncbi:MAG: hypothetical protein AB7U45_00065 [Desulfamplus sp.]
MKKAFNASIFILIILLFSQSYAQEYRSIQVDENEIITINNLIDIYGKKTILYKIIDNDASPFHVNIKNKLHPSPYPLSKTNDKYIDAYSIYYDAKQYNISLDTLSITLEQKRLDIKRLEQEQQSLEQLRQETTKLLKTINETAYDYPNRSDDIKLVNLYLSIGAQTGKYRSYEEAYNKMNNILNKQDTLREAERSEKEKLEKERLEAKRSELENEAQWINKIKLLNPLVETYKQVNGKPLCESAEFYIRKESELKYSKSEVILKWKAEANFPEPSKDFLESGDFTILCQDFFAEQKNGIFRIVGKNSIFDVWNRFPQFYIMYKTGYIYPHIREERYQHAIWVDFTQTGLNFNTNLDLSSFDKELIISAQFNDKEPIPIIFDGKNLYQNIEIKQHDKVMFNIKTMGVFEDIYPILIKAFSIDMKEKEIVIYLM